MNNTLIRNLIILKEPEAILDICKRKNLRLLYKGKEFGEYRFIGPSGCFIQISLKF